MAFVSEAMPRSYLPSQMLVHFNGNNFTIPHIHESQNLKKYFGGDIQIFSEKLPGFAWSRYPGEKHMIGYNYLGQMPVA